MSFITTWWLDGDVCCVYCSRCGVFCFVEQVSVVADMSRRGVIPYCWDCDPEESDVLPKQVYYLEETFLLGVDNVSFLAHWGDGGLSMGQEDLRLTRISAGVWYDLAGGRVAILHKKGCSDVVEVLVGK